MQHANLHRKITAPVLPARILHRQRLVTYLEEVVGRAQKEDGTRARYKLVLLCAPAGYGKTTLLADFARSSLLPCCWYFLEREDSDYVVFLRTLLASLQRQFPCLEQEVQPLFTNLLCRETSTPTRIYQQAIDALCQALASVAEQDFALFLCNYEEVNASATLTHLVDYLLKQLPPQATLVIESRVIPDISFAPLLVRQQMCGMNEGMLRFTAQDIIELARVQGLKELAEGEAEQLAHDFDGWIAGMLLSTYLGDHAAPAPGETGLSEQVMPWYQKKALASQRRKNLFSYLFDEVYKYNHDVKNFMAYACILAHMEPQMCNDLLETDNAEERLAYLERQGLFITSYIDDGQSFYICHPVIRDLFQEQLKKSDPERFSALHRRAARLWQGRGSYEQAMYHALEACAYEQAVEILLIYARALLQQGQVDTIVRWLSAFPSNFLEQQPHLLTIQASTLLAYGQHRKALPLLEQASTLLDAADDTPGSSEQALVLAEIYILRSKALFQEGEYGQALQLCQQALLRLPEHESELRAAAEMRLGICANLQGDFTTGITYLQRALHTWSYQPSLNQAIEIHGALANTYYLVSKLDLAEHHLSCALSYCERAHDLHNTVNNRILQGLILMRQGCFAEAEAVLQQALAQARSATGYQRGEAYALGNLGLLALREGNNRQALAYCQEGLVLACQCGNRSLCNSIYSTMALAYLLLGDQTSAQHFADKIVVGEQTEMGVGYERVWRKLTEGMIYLYQGSYGQAYASLAEIVALLQRTELRQERLQAMLRLAACQVARRQVSEAIELLEEVGRVLDESETDRRLVLVEVEWLVQLRPLIQSEPRLSGLRTLLGLEERPAQTAPVVQEATGPEIAEERCARLKILAFGEPMVLIDEQPIKNWRRISAMELFFFLLDAGQPLSREKVVAALWPEDDEQADKAFHMALYYLRKALGKMCIVFGADGYSLNLAACYGEDVWYDVRDFLQRRSEAEQALERGEEECAQQAWLKMVKLYRGDYGSSFYSDWCSQRRDELRTAYLEALRHLAQAAWRQKDFERSLSYWRKALSVDNCLEQAHHGIMLCYMAQGKRSAALRQYQVCKEILRQELRVEPGASLQGLYQRLRGAADAVRSEEKRPRE
jgi:ATP/maltotriose-dependent transcriptional regulator MalT/two-component SAPR family response regulator